MENIESEVGGEVNQEPGASTDPEGKTPCQSDRWCVDLEGEVDNTGLLDDIEEVVKTPEKEVVLDDRPERMVMLVERGDKPRFRLGQKTAPTQACGTKPWRRDIQEGQQTPMVKATFRCDSQGQTEGGEWKDQEDERVVELREKQHYMMRKLVKEEIARLESQEAWDVPQAGVEIIQKIVEEVEDLEKQLGGRECKMRSLTKKIEEEALQTRLLGLDEVRRNMEDWKEAFQKEYTALTSGPVTPITKQDVEDMRNRGEELEILPMKAIASRKPPDRYKARVVVCGNYSEAKDDENISAGGACSMAIRGVVHTAAVKGWKLGSIDAKGAFLQAPRRPRKTITITEVPSVLKDMNIAGRQEYWQVNCALYGLQESPSDWGMFRDEGLAAMKWVSAGVEYHMDETAEAHLWYIKDGSEWAYWQSTLMTFWWQLGRT